MTSLPQPRPGAGPRAAGFCVTVAVAIGGLVLSGCGVIAGTTGQQPSAGVTPGARGAPTGSPGSASPGDPSASDSPGSEPSGAASPGGTESPSPGGSDTPSGSAAPVTCTEVTPVRVQKSTLEPRRTTEIVTVVSDGRNLTPGTREQSDFLAPTLTAPDGSSITDEATMTKISELISSSSKNRVLLERPEPPDTGADALRPPFSSPGTYVVYNSSSPLNADIVVQCSGQEQRWLFTAEADLTSGQVNCAVEPSRSNAVARLVYQSNC